MGIEYHILFIYFFCEGWVNACQALFKGCVSFWRAEAEHDRWIDTLPGLKPSFNQVLQGFELKVKGFWLSERELVELPRARALERYPYYELIVFCQLLRITLVRPYEDAINNGSVLPLSREKGSVPMVITFRDG